MLMKNNLETSIETYQNQTSQMQMHFFQIFRVFTFTLKKIIVYINAFNVL